MSLLSNLLGRMCRASPPRAAAGASGRNLLPAGGFNRCVLARDGYLLYNSNDVYIGHAIELYGEYGGIEAQLLGEMCRAGMVAVDVGANMGAHTLVLARSVGAEGFVYAYEPQRVVFQALCANVALNSIVNVDARHSAVGSEPGEVLIPDLDYSRHDNFGAVEANAYTRGRKVRKVTLDGDLDPHRLDFIKIDVEGMEREVLQGADGLLRRFHPAIYVENDRQDRSEALIRHLMALDYRLYWHLPPLFNPENFYAETENVYPHVVSVNMICLPRTVPQSLDGFREVIDPAEHPMKKPSEPAGRV